MKYAKKQQQKHLGRRGHADLFNTLDFFQLPRVAATPINHLLVSQLSELNRRRNASYSIFTTVRREGQITNVTFFNRSLNPSQPKIAISTSKVRHKRRTRSYTEFSWYAVPYITDGSTDKSKYVWQTGVATGFVQRPQRRKIIGSREFITWVNLECSTGIHQSIISRSWRQLEPILRKKTTKCKPEPIWFQLFFAEKE